MKQLVYTAANLRKGGNAVGEPVKVGDILPKVIRDSDQAECKVLALPSLRASEHFSDMLTLQRVDTAPSRFEKGPFHSSPKFCGAEWVEKGRIPPEPTVKLSEIIQAAVGLDGSENPEYMRGMCELIARCFPERDLGTDERATEINALVFPPAKEAILTSYPPTTG